MFNPEATHSSGQFAMCTTPWNVTRQALDRMQIFADWFQIPCVERRERSIEQVFTDEHVDVVVVANEDPVLYHKETPNSGLFFHLGMAHQRLVSMNHGDVDRLIRTAQIVPGDHVLDATLGLGADSMVLSSAVGPDGHVTAVESSWFLVQLFLYGIRHSQACPDHLRQLFLNIEVVHGSHREVLRTMESDSQDVVYFDPMFRHPTDKPSSIDAGRSWANNNPICDEVWYDAMRVARKAVVLKERPMSNQFGRFGLKPDRRTTPFAYGIWRKETST